MINRIVKLTFKPENIPAFIEVWKESKSKIIQMEGCMFVEMMQALEPSNVCFTYSVWKDEESLNAYRASALFGATWKKTKALFADKPQAWSTSSHDFEGELIKTKYENIQ